MCVCNILIIICIIGVADGVGGWRNYGIDPSVFPRQLMATCERLVREGHCHPQTPASIIAASYEELQQQKDPLLGQFRKQTFYLIESIKKYNVFINIIIQ